LLLLPSITLAANISILAAFHQKSCWLGIALSDGSDDSRQAGP